MREIGETARRFTNVYVKNFADELDKEKLDKMFSKFGEITSSAVMTDADGKSKGFGFVAFKKPEEAEQVSINISYCVQMNIFSDHIIRNLFDTFW